MLRRRYVLRLALVFGITGLAACSESSSPTAPSSSVPTPAPNAVPTPPSNPAPPEPSNPAPPAPRAPGQVEATINPNPVPHSGQPMTDVSGCASSPRTWYYDLTLRETGGQNVTLTTKTDSFDGRVVNDRRSVNVVLMANGSYSVAQRWCSSASTAHTAQTTYTGQDAAGNEVSVTTPVIQLMAP